MLYMDRHDVEKLRFLLKNALCRYSELCLLPTRGVHFQKNREKKLSEGEECNRKALDGNGDAYMCGLGGPQSGNVQNVAVFNAFWKFKRGYGYSRAKLQCNGPGRFGITLGSLCSLWDDFWCQSGAFQTGFSGRVFSKCKLISLRDSRRGNSRLRGLEASNIIDRILMESTSILYRYAAQRGSDT